MRIGTTTGKIKPLFKIYLEMVIAGDLRLAKQFIDLYATDFTKRERIAIEGIAHAVICDEECTCSFKWDKL